MKELDNLKKELFSAIETICQDYEDKQKQPEFKPGQWVVAKMSLGKEIHLIRDVKPGMLTYDDFNGKSHNHYEYEKFVRPATPQEIESHLRKICDEKYVGKRVKSLFEDEIFFVSKFHQYIGCDTLWYEDIRGNVIKVYGQGKFAEIVPEKKKLPKTKEGIGELILRYHEQNDGLPFKTPVDEFLNDYES